MKTMKTIRISAIAVLLLSSVLFLNGCKKNDTEPGLSAKIQQIVPADLLSTMKAQGMPINEGITPPNIEGIFASSPHTLVSTYEGDLTTVGSTFNDLVMKFSGQNTADGSVIVDTKSVGSTSTGIGGFISGSGNKFSLFAEVNVIQGTITAKQIRVFSGEITSTGIKDFYSTLVIKEKNDPSNLLIGVGKMRIIKDGDGFASKRSSFRLAASPNAATLAGQSDSDR